MNNAVGGWLFTSTNTFFRDERIMGSRNNNIITAIKEMTLHTCIALRQSNEGKEVIGTDIPEASAPNKFMVTE
ncbi:hypothetical protein MACH08_14910 [Oceanobacillus kimchii]|uniref:Uncharacterized protein n=1 Tax=Oceanobacillus kimchii TaxID=746691 RepID=A0ABQ5THW1_9BACI|nr:hypothetical protein MACH08_14910 [Oceanobacillus kimchii]